MSSLNKVSLIGNVGRDPEIRSTQDGREIGTLTLATSESWRDKSTGERKEKTEWHKIVIFNENLVKVAKQYIKKGHKIYIEGALQTRKYTDKDGSEKYSTEVVLQGFNGTLLMLSGEGKSQHEEEPKTATKPIQAKQYKNNDLDDEIPF